MTVDISRELPAGAGSRFDLADFVNPLSLQMLTGERFDSAQVAFTLRDLTDIYARTFDVKYPELTARQILPLYTGVDVAADGFVWRSFDHKGQAQLIDDYAADLPSPEEFATENMSRCYSLGASYNYSIMDLRKATKAGVPLEARKAFTARRAIEQAIEQIAYFGAAQNPGTGAPQAIKGLKTSLSSSDNLQMYGMTNFPGLVGGTGPGAGASNMTTNDWTSDSTSVATIIADWNKNVNAVRTDTLGVHKVNTVVMPLSIWTALQNKPRSATFADDTLLQYLLRMNPEIKNVFYTTMLEAAGFKQDTTTPGPMVIFCERNEENMQLVLPGGFEQLPPQMVNMTFKVPCHQRVAGVRVSYPKAFRALNGMAG